MDDRRKQLLIIPVTGFLCHKVFKYKNNRFRIPRHCTPNSSVGTYDVYKRPYCEGFVKFCLERFHLGIWSSSKEKNLDDALDCLIGRELRQQLLFIWVAKLFLRCWLFQDQEQCTRTEFKCLDNESKPIFLKDLNTVFECPELNADNHCYSASNTLMICGDPVKALVNPPNTTISLDDYTADKVTDDEIGPGGKLRKYLDELSKADDVPSFVKANPIGHPGISSTHPDWSFYSEIVDRHGGKRTPAA
ncbi:hypothetical protein LINPERHAP1_LOCUS26970 [Linum perenne]